MPINELLKRSPRYILPVPQVFEGNIRKFQADLVGVFIGDHKEVCPKTKSGCNGRFAINRRMFTKENDFSRSGNVEW